MQKLLIMGGSYFIGKHVIDALKDTHEIYVLNRGTHPLQSQAITQLVADRNDVAQMKNALSGHTFDAVIDISAFTQEQSVILLEALDTEALKHFIFISTAAVYGTKGTPPYKESDSVDTKTNPFGDYAYNKIACETYLRSALGPILTILRPPFVYGEFNYILRERLLFHLLENEWPVYVPKSTNRIQFVYARDLAQTIKAVLEGAVPPDTYNVGDTTPITLVEWIHLCGYAAYKTPWIIEIDPAKTDVPVTHYFPFPDMEFHLDVSKINKFHPEKIVMLDGLKAAFNDYTQLSTPLSMPKRMIKARKQLSEHDDA